MNKGTGPVLDRKRNRVYRVIRQMFESGWTEAHSAKKLGITKRAFQYRVAQYRKLMHLLEEISRHEDYPDLPCYRPAYERDDSGRWRSMGR
jgi:hypothetical protein